MPSSCTLSPTAPPSRSNAEGRGALLELGGAELARARRYGRELGLVTVALADGAADRALGFEVVEAVLRTGPDRAIEIEDGLVAALLPETPLSGAIHVAERMQRRLREAGLAARVGFAALDRQDARFVDMLARATAMAMPR